MAALLLASVPFLSGGSDFCLAKGGGRIGVEWVFDKSFLDFSLYNEIRPHKTLAYKTPAHFEELYGKCEVSCFFVFKIPQSKIFSFSLFKRFLSLTKISSFPKSFIYRALSGKPASILDKIVRKSRLVHLDCPPTLDALRIPRPLFAASPAERVAVESEEIPNIAQFSPRGGNGAVLGISELE